MILHYDARVSSAAFAPESARIVVACWDNTARVWDATSRGEITALRGHKDGLGALPSHRMAAAL